MDKSVFVVQDCQSILWVGDECILSLEVVCHHANVLYGIGIGLWGTRKRPKMSSPTLSLDELMVANTYHSLICEKRHPSTTGQNEVPSVDSSSASRFIEGSGQGGSDSNQELVRQHRSRIRFQHPVQHEAPNGILFGEIITLVNCNFD